MSTIVQIPVRVKPPPADTGETISPGCASFEIATPLNGARMIVLSSSVLAKSTCRSATLTCSPAAQVFAALRIHIGLGTIDLGLRHDAVLEQRLQPAQRQLRFRQPHL